jgi:glutathione synthase/RimK-type ligase-like ATP-grasp enzyme
VSPRIDRSRVAPRSGEAAVGPRIALATCAAFPQLAEDEPLLLDALRARGALAEPVVWDDPAVDWEAYTLVVVRSTWDYARRRERFLAWAERVPRLLNAAEVIRWNTDKHYLPELPYAVATEFVEPGNSAAWSPPSGEYVVKPAVSSGSRHAARYRPGEEHRARAHVAGLVAIGRSVIVQPYLDAVDRHGETALLFFAGRYSHSIRKGQMLSPARAPAANVLYVEEEIRSREPDPAERAAAEDVLDALPWRRDELLYARVDLIAGADGAPRLVELELTEPSLFLSYGEGAAARLAEQVLERV